MASQQTPVTVSELVTWVSFAVSFVSVVLGILAIWLSVQFYRWSQASQKAIEDASGVLGKAVDRLEVTVGNLYNDAFDLLRTSYKDMSEHVWTNSGINTQDDDLATAVDLQIRERIAPVEAKFAQALNEMEIDKANRSRLEALAEELVNRTASETKEAEVEAPVDPKGAVLAFMRRRPPVPLTTLLQRLDERFGLDSPVVVSALFDLRNAGRITWDGPADTLAGGDTVRYVKGSQKDTAASGE